MEEEAEEEDDENYDGVVGAEVGNVAADSGLGFRIGVGKDESGRI